MKSRHTYGERRRIHGYLGRDQQFWDLGRFTSQIKTKEEVELRIAELEKEFDLGKVLILN